MDQDKNRLRNMLAQRLSELENTPPPKGLVVCEDIDIDIFEYDAHVAGLAKSHLSGLTVDPTLVFLGENLSRTLDECERKLCELRAYKDLVSEVASLLLECLSLDR